MTTVTTFVTTTVTTTVTTLVITYVTTIVTTTTTTYSKTLLIHKCMGNINSRIEAVCTYGHSIPQLDENMNCKVNIYEDMRSPAGKLNIYIIWNNELNNDNDKQPAAKYMYGRISCKRRYHMKLFQIFPNLMGNEAIK